MGFEDLMVSGFFFILSALASKVDLYYCIRDITGLKDELTFVDFKDC